LRRLVMLGAEEVPAPPRPSDEGPGRTALVDALEAGDFDEAARLLEGPRVEHMLSVKSAMKGMTPLMLVANGRGPLHLGLRILEFGPDVAGVTIRSSSGRTAAEYAQIHSMPETFSKHLKLLTEAEFERTAEGRCPVCRAPLCQRPRLAELVARFKRGEEDNARLARFLEESSDSIWALCAAPFHSLHVGRGSRQKLARSLAMIDTMQRAVPTDGWHVVDLCSGKSMTTSLLAVNHPGVVVTAIDRLASRFVPHYAAAGKLSVTYHEMDVLADGFVEKVAEMVEVVGRPTVVMGMHLCGKLSERAIETFHRIPLARVCVLSPCCLPHRDDAPPALAPLYRSRTSFTVDAEQYAAWGRHLEEKLRQLGAEVEAGPVEDMLSIKNTVICARKPECAPSVLDSSSKHDGRAAECIA